MTPPEVALAAAAIVGSLSGLAALIKAVHDRRQGLSSNERIARRDAAEDRRDTIGDRDALIDQQQEELARYADRLTKVEDRLTLVERTNRLLWQHNGALIHHIEQGFGPPPPRAPEGL